VPKRIDAPIGTRFGSLTIDSELAPVKFACGSLKRKMKCVCDCGAISEVLLNDLVRGHTKSCKCLQIDTVTKNNYRHGQVSTMLYSLWANIRSRTVTGSSDKRKGYKGRGITMHTPWVDDFVSFHTWIVENLGERPQGLSLNRLDNDKGYEPGNLEWATPKQQANNTRRNVYVEFQGERLTVAQWADALSIRYMTLWYRLFKYNWTVEKALTAPLGRWPNAN